MNVTLLKTIRLIQASIFLTSLLFSFAIDASSTQISGIKLKESIKLGKNNLLLNGAGQRTKFYLDLYIAALYLNEKSHNPQEIIAADAPMLIQVHVISNLITSENLTRGTMEGFTKSTSGNTQSIQATIDDFLDSFKGKIEIGDTFEIVYLPNKGITVIKNRKVVKRLSVDLEFKQALFGIWLSNNPAQESLKKKLLGK